MRTTTHRRRMIAILAAAGAATCAPAFGQNALGSGRALDANLQQGGSRFNPPGRNSNFNEEVRFRNAIVTGNAPGGLSFRGDAGYASSDDFRADTGSNTLFNFQRDSIYSGLATRGIRNIEALRAQMSLTTGGAPTFDTGGLFIQRASAGASVADLRPSQPQLSIDPFTSRPGSLRSTSTFISTQSIEPQFFGTTNDQAGQPYAVGASPLRGVIAQPLLVSPDATLPGTAPVPGSSVIPAPIQPDQAAQQPGAQPQPGGLTFNPADLAPQEPAQPRPGQVAQTPTTNRVSNAIDRQTVGSEPTSARLAPRSAYDALMSDYVSSTPQPAGTATPTPLGTIPGAPGAPGAPGTAGVAGEQPAPAPAQPGASKAPTFFESVQELRRQILGLPATDGEAGPGPIEVIDPQTGEPVQAPRPDRAVQSIRERAAQTFGEVAAPRLDTLAPTGADETIYTRHLREGEALLKAERWFDAEEAFTRAINRRPGDPIASAGRINAQLGAAMYLSAATNLRALFSAHPEMAGVRFRQELFLKGERATQVIAYLRDEMTKERAFAREAALLLAFIGYQTGDKREVQNAFEAYDRNAMLLAVIPDPLVEMLKGAWLDAPERRAGGR